MKSQHNAAFHLPLFIRRFDDNYGGRQRPSEIAFSTPLQSGKDLLCFAFPAVQRQRATILKPGSMFVSQPRLPVPVLLEFPFPAWATRSAEAAATSVTSTGDPFDGLT